MLLPMVIAFALTTAVASAGKLPKGAVEMTRHEVKKIFSDTTAFYSKSDQYYAPDGTTKGVFGKPRIVTTFKGTWSVKGNEFCAKNGPKGESTIYIDCFKFWKSGDQVYGLWTVHYDGTTVDEKNGYYTDELKHHLRGDQVSKKYAAAGGT